RRRHTSFSRDWSSDVCSSDLFEKELKDYLINNLPKSQAEGISGKSANAKIVRKEIPFIEDEKKVLAFAKKPGNEDLIKVSVNTRSEERRVGKESRYRWSRYRY